MESYCSAWRTFRALSNENERTAAHLVAQPRWPRRESISICDLGCGDGLLLHQLTLANPESIGECHLVDPDPELLTEAYQRILKSGLGRKVSASLGSAEDVFPRCADAYDVVLLVHVVYLMANGALRRVLAAIPAGVPLYVVLDSPDSVFTELWARTAPKYHARALLAHQTIQDLPRQGFAVHSSTISSEIKDPLRLERQDLGEAVLSLLCYGAVHADPDLLAWAKAVVARHVAGEVVQCTSVCYEIVRV